MKLYRIGVDVDGVLAEFNQGYRQELIKVCGRDHLGGDEPPCWHWAEEVGYSKEEDAQAWEAIKGSPSFWMGLRPLLEAPETITILNSLYHQGHEVYYISHRFGTGAHVQTAAWLMQQGALMPTVLMSGDKGPIAKGLELTHFIDDKPENALEVRLQAPSCKTFLLSKSYNKIWHDHLAEGIIVVDTLKEFFVSLAFEAANA